MSTPLRAEVGARLLVGAGGRVHERPQDAVREPGLRVGLEDHRAHAEEGGERARPARRRSRRRRAPPRGAAGARARRRGARPQGRARRPRSARERAHAVEGQDGQQLERVAGRGHEPRLEAARRSPRRRRASRGRGARSSSATAMPGKRWPPVPPAAMRIVRERHSVRMLGHVQDRGPRPASVKTRRRAARADEGKRDALGGHEPEDHARC